MAAIIRRIFPDVQFYSREPRETRFSRVYEAKDKTIVVDLNHLLAGKTLNFDVKVTDIKAADAR
jgi:FKBP-type peptidyl-prolyl cis-trans isomerase 2